MDRDRLAQARGRQLHAPFEGAARHPHEGDAVAVVGVHIGLDLEDETGDLVAVRRHLLLARGLRARRRGMARDRLDQFGNAEILERAAEIHRRQVAIAERLEIEFGIADLRQFDFLGEHFRDRGVAIAGAGEFLRRPLGPRDAAGGEIEHAFELPAHPHRIGLRRHVEREHIGDLVEQLEHRAPLAVDLVDEGDDRHAAQAADLEQLARLRLDSLGRVDHHDRRIDRGQRAVGVLGKILVPRRVEQVEGDSLPLEGHHAGGHRDAALLLDLHPVRARAPRSPARLDLAREMDRAAGQQQLLGQRGLARVGMRDDREGAARAGGAGGRIGHDGAAPTSARGAARPER